MLKEFFKKGGEGQDKKRQIENIIVFIIILIITVIIINNMWKTEDKKIEKEENETNKVLATNISNNVTSKDDLEKRLEEILGSINGVGKVKVLMKYSESSTVVAMYNETTSQSKSTENSKDGGSKDTTETESKKEIVYSDENGKNEPITERIIMPTIEGAIITAQGAENANIKTSIVSAVEAVTGLAVHKIQVFEMGKEDKR
ncbi:MAG: hypothetical protein HFJ55_02785 [Clostridia bacterium]|nr:hypothetical protein [Clostridia bacterium]